MPVSLLDLAADVLAHGGAAVRVADRFVPLQRHDHGPLGLLGIRFGPGVDAVALALAPDGPVLALERSGETLLADRGGRHEPIRADGSLALDLARRSLGLATAPPDRRVAELVDTVWLERVLDATLDAPLGDPPRWLALAQLHPAARGARSPSPELLRHRADRLGGWCGLRDDVITGRRRWPPVSATLAAWFDAGSLARHAFATLPDASVIAADLDDLLRPADAGRLRAALSPR